MDARNFIAVAGFIAILALAFGLLVVPSLGAAKESLKISLSAAPEKIFSGGTLEANASAEGAAIESISLALGSEKKAEDCSGGNRCFVSAEFRPEAGIYLLKAVVLLSNGATETRSKKIMVLEEKRECVNNVEFGACSNEKPFYCNSGILEENCGECGCNEGFYCSGKSCAAEAGKIEFAGVIAPERVLAGKAFRVTAKLKALENIRAGARYSAEIFFGKQKISGEFTAKELVAGQEFEWVVDSIKLSAGTYDINFSLYALNAEKTLAANYYGKNAVQALSEINPPAAPSITSAFAEGDDIVLNWTKVADAHAYRLYKSADANPVFISYKLHQTFDGNETSAVLQGAEKGAHYFVMTALNEFGGESGFSEVENVVVG